MSKTETTIGTRLASVAAGEPREAELGRPATPQERRVRLILLMIAVALALVAYASRAIVATSGTHHLPVRDLAWVVPGKLMRSSQPQDIDFANLRDQFGIGGVVNLRQVESLEPQVVNSFGMAYLHLAVAPNTVPTEAQLAAVVSFVTRQVQAHHAVLIHDENGRDPVTLVTALLAVLHSVSSQSAVNGATVHGSRPRWTSNQVEAFNEVARALGEPVYLPATFHPTKTVYSGFDPGALRW